MTFNWEIHKPLIRRLYIDEGRTLEEIQEFMKTVHDFSPSRRSWQQHLHRWGFKKHFRTEIGDENLVARVRELWAKNLPHRQILDVLVKEGKWEVNSRVLKKIRVKNNLALRNPRSLAKEVDKSTAPTKELPSPHHVNPVEATSSILPEAQVEPVTQPEFQSDRRGRARHSQKSDGTSSRFPSEMTVEEARLLLSLDDAQYGQLASEFRNTCQQNGIMKKTSVSSELWETLKSQLISDIPQLQRALVRFPDNLEMKNLALEIICANVTKRMRVATTKIGLPEAKNILGLNPDGARQMREALFEVLRDANCSSKSDITSTEWKQLKRQWGEKCEAVQRALDLSPDHADYNKMYRAVELIAKNVIARIQQIRKQKGEYTPRPRKKQPAVPISQRPDIAPVPDADISQVADGDPVGFLSNDEAQNEINYNTIASQHLHSRYGRAVTRLPAAGAVLRAMGETPTTQAHVAVTGLSELSATDHQVPSVMQGDSQQQFLFPTTATAFQDMQPVRFEPVAAYFRVRGTSTVASVTLWIATMHQRSVLEIRKLVADRHPDSFCARIEGMVKSGMAGELPLKIDDDEQLRAYISHLRGTAAPTFRIHLA